MTVLPEIEAAKMNHEESIVQLNGMVRTQPRRRLQATTTSC